MSQPLRVLFLAAESVPFMKVGGLGDVIGSLPGALQKLPERPDIRVVLPMHGGIDKQRFGLQELLNYPIRIPGSESWMDVQVWESNALGMPYYFIGGGPVAPNSPVYSSVARNDIRKFAFVSFAALKLGEVLNWQPEVLHAHDWHMALAVHWLKVLRAESKSLQATRSILTIHNLPYQGQGTEPELAELGIVALEGINVPPWAKLNPMALGIDAADQVTTVSPGYAREIQTQEFGAGLNEFVRTHSEKTSGILNGIDTDTWNPRTDPFIAARYGLENLGVGRRTNKASLLKKQGWLENDNAPLLAMVGRMDSQKGVDIALDALTNIVDQEWQVIFLGTGAPEIEQEVSKFCSEHPERASAYLRYEESVAHMIFSGADVILIPSRYEPCGLTQMIAMRYGCVPIARRVGGLGDTVRSQDHEEDATGFLVDGSDAVAFSEALELMLGAFQDKAHWHQLQENGMKLDFSWENSAREYYELYESLAHSGREHDT